MGWFWQNNQCPGLWNQSNNPQHFAWRLWAEERRGGEKGAAGFADAPWPEAPADTACPALSCKLHTLCWTRDRPDLLSPQPTDQHSTNNMHTVTCLPLYSVTSTVSAYHNYICPLYLSSLIRSCVWNITGCIGRHSLCWVLFLALKIMWWRK